MAMIFIVCGDRNWVDFGLIEFVLAGYPDGSTLIHGNCRGVDEISGYLGKERGFTVTPVPADWAKYGKSAGPIRNRLMLMHEPKPERVLAFHDNIRQSKGTKDMINAALETGVTVVLFSTHNDPIWIYPHQRQNWMDNLP